MTGATANSAGTMQLAPPAPETTDEISESWRQALAALEDDLRRRAVADKTRRAYAIDSRQFARWASNLTYDDLPASVVDKVKALILIHLTGGTMGAQMPRAKELVELVRREDSKPDGATFALVLAGRPSDIQDLNNNILPILEQAAK